MPTSDLKRWTIDRFHLAVHYLHIGAIFCAGTWRKTFEAARVGRFCNTVVITFVVVISEHAMEVGVGLKRAEGDGHKVARAPFALHTLD